MFSHAGPDHLVPESPLDKIDLIVFVVKCAGNIKQGLNSGSTKMWRRVVNKRTKARQMSERGLKHPRPNLRTIHMLLTWPQASVSHWCSKYDGK